ncbi:S16 family serine protease [Pseudolysinimonas sp.]
MSSRRLASLATAGLALLGLAGCSLIPLPANVAGRGFRQDGQVTVSALYAAGDTGGVSDQTISMGISQDGDLRIDFSENEVAGFGDMTRAASWNAVTVATILTGAPLDRQYRFAFDGRIDGPSAGALTTVAVLSLLLGDTIDPQTTMTGTINPTGTIGAVGGIPEKIQGVIDAGELTTVLIPEGQRNVANAQGEMVDVVRLGSDADLEVIEVATIYEAYERLTGEELPAPNASSPELDANGYDKLEAATTAALARYDRAASQFAGLDPSIQSAAGTLPAEAAAIADRARSLQTQGLPAGAFTQAQAAAVNMEAIFNTFDTVQGLLISGAVALETKLAAASTAISSFEAHLDTLGTYDPKSLTDVEALVTSYANSFDAYSMLAFGQGILQGLYDQIAAGQPIADEVFLQSLLLPLIYFEFGRGQLEFARAVFDVGRDNDSGTISASADVAALGSYLRRGADANWAAFETGVISTNAESLGVSNDVFRNRLANVDFTVALAFAAQQGQAYFEQYIGEGEPNAAYAAMGYGVFNYARNALLLEKYAHNGVLDENLNVVSVQSDALLSTSLDLGREQVERALGVLEDQGVTTVITVGSFEGATLDREGDIAARFGAIQEFSAAFLLARGLAYIGGYPSTGWAT